MPDFAWPTPCCLSAAVKPQKCLSLLEVRKGWMRINKTEFAPKKSNYKLSNISMKWDQKITGMNISCTKHLQLLPIYPNYICWKPGISWTEKGTSDWICWRGMFEWSLWKWDTAVRLFCKLPYSVVINTKHENIIRTF